VMRLRRGSGPHDTAIGGASAREVAASELARP